jgi:hypothetical protein
MEKVLKWLMFSVLLALVPIAFGVLSYASRNSGLGLQVSTARILSHGELLLVASALCAAAVGESFGEGKKYRIPKLLSAGCAIIILLFSALYFADASAAYLAEVEYNENLVRTTSIYVFIAAVIASGSCIALAELK